MSSPGGGPSVVLITVGVDAQGNPTCTPMDIEVWKTLGDTVKWMSSGIGFEIVFAAGSPFAQSRFSGPMASSGAIQGSATGQYKYAVQIGSKILDPKIGVRPP